MIITTMMIVTIEIRRKANSCFDGDVRNKRERETLVANNERFSAQSREQESDNSYLVIRDSLDHVPRSYTRNAQGKTRSC